MADHVLVTGGCGFIGANLVPELIESGRRVRVLDNLAGGDPRHLDGLEAEIVEGDVRDGEDLEQAMKGVTAVVHLAAYGNVVESVIDPGQNFENNVRGTFMSLKACANAGVERFVFASTGGGIMGNTPPPVDETTLPWPVSPYGASKLCGEAYCHAFAGSLDVPCTVLRFANVYGPKSAHKQGAVTRFIVAAMRNEPLTIYGDGEATRDFLYVGDVCQGVLGALDSDGDDDIFHLATGEETSVRDLASLILELTDREDVPVVYADARRGEVERMFASSDAARRSLGFAPRHSLREGLQVTVEWFRECGVEALR